MLKTACFTLMVMFAGGAAAQNSARPDAADPKAAVPGRAYESVFKDYRPYADPEIKRWRQSNEEMGRLGGHVGHVPPESGAAAKPGAKPAALGHGEQK